MVDTSRDLIKRISHAVEKQEKSLGYTDESDAKAEQESQEFRLARYEEVQRQKALTAGIKETNRDLRHNRKLRSAYAKLVFRYLVGYSVFVGLLLILSGFNICGFTLESSVLEFLVGSTVASAIGLVFAVTHGLFNGVSKRPSKE
ncbi:MAG: hypothetical protein ACWA40_10545 [Planktomarina sp.]